MWDERRGILRGILNVEDTTLSSACIVSAVITVPETQIFRLFRAGRAYRIRAFPPPLPVAKAEPTRRASILPPSG
jgi:hypothetical protein